MIPILPHGSRQLRGLLAPAIAGAATVPGADKYRKRFTTWAHLWMLIEHGLSGGSSLRQSHARLATEPTLCASLGLDDGISLSQLARSSTSRPIACAETVLANLLAVALQQPITDPTWQRLRPVLAIDSTFIRLSAVLCPWSLHKGFTPGVRIQTNFDVARQIPTRLGLSLADLNDHHALKQQDLDALRGWTILIDRGYYGHQQFARLRQAGVSFITPRNDQAVSHVTATHPLPEARTTPQGDVVLADQTITLGSPNNRAGAVLPGVRLITSRNAAGEEMALLTDRVDLTATEVCQLYRLRWQIELFFRFLKHQLGLLRPLGYSRQAVWLTVLLAAIIAVLLVLTDRQRPHGMSRVSWLQQLHIHLLLSLRGG
jgi:Transposase DDE domain